MHYLIDETKIRVKHECLGPISKIKRFLFEGKQTEKKPERMRKG